MRTSLVLAAALILVSCVSGKVIAEGPTPTKEAEDTRLLQPVTIECANMRLHTVLERLSAATGVTMGAGRDSKDWQVRDIPVVVCVKEVPLGKLLGMIADSTHLLISRYTSEDGKVFYRLWRDMNRRREIDGYFESITTYRRENAIRFLEEWSRVKDMPDSEFRPDRLSDFTSPIAKATSRLVSELNQESVDFITSGPGRLSITLATCPETVRSDLEAGFRDLWRERQENAVKNKMQPLPTLTEELLNQCSVRILSDDMLSPSGSQTRLGVVLDAKEGSFAFEASTHALLFSLRENQDKTPVLPKWPRPPRWQPGKQYIFIDPWSDNQEEAVKSLLEKKVTLKPPKDKAEPTYADALAALSRALDIQMICEDFESHHILVAGGPDRKSRDFFGKEVTVRNILRGSDTISWYIDQDKHLILGTTQWTKWAGVHKNLAPESVVTNLLGKLNGPGAELQDLEPLALLDFGQVSDWISSSPDMVPLRNTTGGWGPPLWRLYFKLPRQLRASVGSRSGLSLAALDPLWIRDAIWLEGGHHECVLLADGRIAPNRKDENLLTDPEALPLMVMRMTTKEKDGKRLHTITVEGQEDEKSIKITQELGPFPVYSPRREAEIKKNQAAEQKPKVP